MPGTDVAAAREARVGRFAWIIFGLSVLFVAVLAVVHARGSETSWTVWGLALFNIVNATGGLPGLALRVSRALTMLSAAMLLATLAAMVVSALR